MKKETYRVTYGYKVVRPMPYATLVQETQPSRIAIIYKYCVDLLHRCVLPCQGIMNLTKMIVRIIRA